MSAQPDGFTVILEQPDFIIVNKMIDIDMHDDEGVPGLVSRVSAFLGMVPHKQLYP